MTAKKGDPKTPGSGKKKIVIGAAEMQLIKENAGLITAKEIADLIGISRQTFFDRLNDNEALSRLYRGAVSKRHAFATDSVYNRAFKGYTFDGRKIPPSDKLAELYVKCKVGWTVPIVRVEASDVENDSVTEAIDDIVNAKTKK